MQISDHDAQLLTFKIASKRRIRNNKPLTRTVRIFSEKTSNNFQIWWARRLGGGYSAPVNSKFNIFNNIFMRIMLIYVSQWLTICRGTNQKVPWNNFELVPDKNIIIERSTFGGLTKYVDTIHLAKQMNKVLKENIFKAK